MDIHPNYTAGYLGWSSGQLESIPPPHLKTQKVPLLGPAWMVIPFEGPELTMEFQNGVPKTALYYACNIPRSGGNILCSPGAPVPFEFPTSDFGGSSANGETKKP